MSKRQLVQVNPTNPNYDSSTRLHFKRLKGLLEPAHELFFVGTTSKYYEVYLPTRHQVIKITEAVSVFLATLNPKPELEQEYGYYYIPKKALKDPEVLESLLDSISQQYLGDTGLLFASFENK